MTTLSSVRALATLAIVATTSACSSISPARLIAASRLDPMNTPPSELSVAVGVTETLRLADADTEFRIAFRSGSAASTVMIEETAPLRLTVSGADGPRPNALDETVYVASFAPQDAARIADAHREIRTLRASGVDGEGSIAIQVVGGCFVGPRPASIEVSTWLQTNPADSFVQLTRRQDVVQAFGAQDAATLIERLKPCTTEE